MRLLHQTVFSCTYHLLGSCIRPDQQAEQLLPSPQLNGLQNSRCRQVNVVQRFTHASNQLTELSPAIEAILTGD